ncbi:MAG: hypothetical protein EOO89_25625, partial [Pedobacter sp.]
MKIILPILLSIMLFSPFDSGFQIYVTTPYDTTITIDVDGSDSIENLKEKIYDNTGVPPQRQRLLYGNTTLVNGQTLADYNVQSNNTIRLRYVEVPISQIFVRLPDGRTKTIDVYNSDSTENLKTKIEGLTGISPIDQLIDYNGYILKDGRTLGEQGLQNEVTLYLTVRTLPIQLISFKVKPFLNATKGVSLEWTTSNEEGVSDFVVLKSTGNEFYQIGKVQAKQTSSVHTYHFNDMEAVTGSAYYQLKINETNGKHSFSEVDAVSASATSLLVAYPNPVVHTLNVQYPLSLGLAKLQVVDLTGKLVRGLVLPPHSGHTSVNLADLATGN